MAQHLLYLWKAGGQTLSRKPVATACCVPGGTSALGGIGHMTKARDLGLHAN